MSTKTEKTPDQVTVTVSKDQGEFAIIRAKRIGTGIELYLRSAKLEELFRSMSSGEAPAFQGRKGYTIPEIRTENSRTYNWGSMELLSGETALLSVFLGKGLAEGYTLKLANGVVSQETLTTWTNKAQQALKKIYQRYLAPFSIEVEISFKESSSNG